MKEDLRFFHVHIFLIISLFSGSLTVRNLADIVTENDFIQSEKLTTVFVVVSRFCTIIFFINLLPCVTYRGQIKDWGKTYFTLADRVVPHSSRLVAEDDQNLLYSVVLFKSSVDQFKANARDARFQVREFTQTAETPQSIEEEKLRLRQQAESQMVYYSSSFPFFFSYPLFFIFPLPSLLLLLILLLLLSYHQKSYLEWCQSSYTEMMKIWMHLKLLRVFTESVLRFSLPVNFQAVAFIVCLSSSSSSASSFLYFFFYVHLSSPSSSLHSLPLSISLFFFPLLSSAI